MTELFAITGHPAVLAAPILRVTALLYPDATVTNRAGFAFAVESPSGRCDYDALRRLIEALDELGEP